MSEAQSTPSNAPSALATPPLSFVAYVAKAPRCRRTKGSLQCGRAEGHNDDKHQAPQGVGVASWTDAECEPELAPPSERTAQLPAPKTDPEALRFWASLSPETVLLLLETRPTLCRAWELHEVAGVSGVREMHRRRVDNYVLGAVHATLAGRSVIAEPGKEFFWRAGMNGEYGGYAATARAAMEDVDGVLVGGYIRAVLVGGVPDVIPDLAPIKVAALLPRPDALENK
ncbi:MAG: hypothetical protein ACHREM_00180 [Polyangiales bacterium]